MRTLLVLSLFLGACTAAATTSPDDDAPNVDAQTTAIHPQGAPPQTPTQPPPQTPSRWINLRVAPQVIVRRPGIPQAYFVASDTNINLPCNTTTVYFDVIYTNIGNVTAGAHTNSAYWGNINLSPYQTESKDSAEPGSPIIETFSRTIANALPNVPTVAKFRVDDPDVLDESLEMDNYVAIRVTRVCP